MEKDEITVKGKKSSITGGEYEYEHTYKVGEYAMVVEVGNTYNGRFGKILSISHEDETVDIEFTNGEVVKGLSAHNLLHCGEPIKKRTKEQIIEDIERLLKELKEL